MVTLHGSKRNVTASIGFFVLVAAAISVSTLVRGSTVVGIVFLVIALGLAVLALVVQQMPANELRITPDAIELARPKRIIGSLSRGDTGGQLEIRREIFKGRTFWSLVPPGAPPRTGISVDDFDPAEIHSAAAANGWAVVALSEPAGAVHRCVPPDDAQGPSWAGRRDAGGAPLWACSACRRWWAYGWPGFGGHPEAMTWLPMRDVFTGHDPDTFQDIIEVERRRDRE